MWASSGGNIFMARGVFKLRVLVLHLLDLDKILDRLTLGGKILCEPHVCYYHACRDLLEHLFFNMANMPVDGV